MNFSDTRIATRLGFAFGLLFLLMTLAIGVAIVNLRHIRSEFRDVMEDDYPTTMVFVGVKDDMNLVARSIRNMLLLSEPDAVKAEHERVRGALKSIEAHLAKGESLMVNDSERAALAKIVVAHNTYLGPMNHAVELALAGSLDEGKVFLVKEVRPVQQALFNAVDEMAKLQANAMAQSGAGVEQAVDHAMAWMAGLCVLGLAASLALGTWITRSIIRPMSEAVSVSRAVAAGDLTMRFDGYGRNEVAQLLHALHDMQDSLARVVGGVRQGADNVATASAQISQGNLDLSQRTEEQASALEQTAASMEQLSAAVRQNAEHARQANQFAMGANEVATKGSEVVGQVVATMKGINDSSKRIADIIGVIDGIAFQTNILALNAAVEAARAGEQGRGFAVVAAEVRSLAGRSAEAAKEIKTLINASVERVDHGAALVDQAGHTMTEVLTAIRRVTDIVGEISTASGEQSAGVSQVSQAVSQMDQVTQQNAALVEESAAAAESLKTQAEHLVQSVAVFKLTANQQATAVRPPAHVTRIAPAVRMAPAPKPAQAEAPVATPPARLPAPAAAATVSASISAGSSDDWETF